jgi:hypothetical protein
VPTCSPRLPPACDARVMNSSENELGDTDALFGTMARKFFERLEQWYRPLFQILRFVVWGAFRQLSYTDKLSPRIHIAPLQVCCLLKVHSRDR